MSANSSLRIGVYGPVGSGKSLFILRWLEPKLKMTQLDLEGNPFINLYRTSSFGDNIELIEHPSDDKIDPTEDHFVIIGNMIGWRDIYENARSINSQKVHLVFTWKDRPNSIALSAKIHEKHYDCSSYTGANFDTIKNSIVGRRVSSSAGNSGNKSNKKRHTQIDSDGWVTK